MGIKQKVIDRLSDRTRKDVLIKIRQDFIKEDTEEPFKNREYVKDTLKIFDMLISGDEDEFIEINGGALCDVVSDIFRHYEVIY